MALTIHVCLVFYDDQQGSRYDDQELIQSKLPTQLMLHEIYCREDRQDQPTNWNYLLNQFDSIRFNFIKKRKIL